MSGGVTVAWEWPDAGTATAAVLSKVSAPAKKVIESSGFTFERAVARWVPKKEVVKSDSDRTDSPPSSPTMKKEAKKKKQTSTKLSEAELEGDHYEVLGLGDIEWEATDEQIAKAYKQACLESHPDKTGGDDKLFKKVQIAGDVLSTDNKRKAYDSSLPFDDSVPKGACPADRFFATYGPVFYRNSKWYLHGKEKCPPLGDDDTPMAEVDAFYTFWLGFKTWRDFSHSAAEHDLEQAEHRDERRWMERENQRAVDKAKKSEMARIVGMVERSYRQDPRIKRREQAVIDEKAAKVEAKRAEEQAKKQAEIDAVANAKQAEEDKRKLKKEVQEKTKRCRQTVRRATRDYAGNPEEGDVNMEDVDWLLTKLDLPAMEAICVTIEPLKGQKEALISFIYEQVEDCELRINESRTGKSLGPAPEKDEAVAATKEAEVVWSDAELLELQKACTKFPAGAMERWIKLSEYMQGKKTPQQCLKQVKVMEREYKMPQQGVTGGLKAASGNAVLPKSEKKDDTIVNADNTRKFKDVEKHADPASEEDVWSAAEQKSLETALRDLKEYKDKDKWEKIAEAVGTKSKKQCVARFKFLSSSVKK